MFFMVKMEICEHCETIQYVAMRKTFCGVVTLMVLVSFTEV